MKRVYHRDKHASRSTLHSKKNAIALEQKTHSQISQLSVPRGSAHRHRQYGNTFPLSSRSNETRLPSSSSTALTAIAELATPTPLATNSFSAPVDPSWKPLLEKLERMGLTQDVIESHAEFITSYVNRQFASSAPLRNPDSNSSLALPVSPSENTSTHKHRSNSRKVASQMPPHPACPPPPPPSRRRASSDFRSKRLSDSLFVKPISSSINSSDVASPPPLPAKACPPVSTGYVSQC